MTNSFDAVRDQAFVLLDVTAITVAPPFASGCVGEQRVLPPKDLLESRTGPGLRRHHVEGFSRRMQSCVVLR